MPNWEFSNKILSYGIHYWKKTNENQTKFRLVHNQKEMNSIGTYSFQSEKKSRYIFASCGSPQMYDILDFILHKGIFAIY